MKDLNTHGEHYREAMDRAERLESLCRLLDVSEWKYIEPEVRKLQRDRDKWHKTACRLADKAAAKGVSKQ